MYRHAICDKNGNVINVILWDGVAPWKPRDPSHAVIRHDECDVGDLYQSETNSFIKSQFRTDKKLKGV